MKFGDTLWQRSVPQWQNFNIDYQTLKTYVKDSTTPSKFNDTAVDKGKAKAVSIPIPGSKSSTDVVPTLEDRLFGILQTEHERVGLFVRSKWYEIGSRLGSIERQLSQLQRRRPVGVGSSKAALNLRARFSKIESDILGVGNEIQNLSRFVAINRLAIRKLLKKHKKWTGSVTLGPKVEEQLLESPDSFTKVKLDEALGRYTSFLSAVREPFSDQPAMSSGGVSDRSPVGIQENLSRSSHDLAAGFRKSDTDFDAAMALLCKSQDENKAVYWVHKDNVMELRILLLQYMRYASFGSPDDAQTSGNSPSETSKPDNLDGKGTCAGAIVMAGSDLKSDASRVDQQASTTDSPPAPAAVARWTTNGNARVCLRSSKTDTDTLSTKNIMTLDRDRLLALLPLDPAARRSQISKLTDEELYATSDDDKDHENALRGYIQRSDELKAVARITHKRSRFVGLENTSNQGFWASLDEEIRYASMSGNERKTSEVYKIPDEEGRSFPHSVLSLKSEGASPSLMNVLNESHLTERVEDFTLEAHVFAVCRQGADRHIPWLSKLSTDIRHIPSVSHSPLSESRTCSRKSSNIEQLTNSSSSKLTTPNLNSISGNSGSAGPVTPDTELFVPPAIRAPIKKSSRVSLVKERASQRARKLRERKSQLEVQIPPEQQKRYWNEYDNPGSDMGGDDEFFLYVDPDAPLFPGQIVLTRWGQSIKGLFNRAISKDEPASDLEQQRKVDGTHTISRQISQLLSPDSGSTSSDEDEDHIDADDELSQHLLRSSRFPHFPRKQGLGLTTGGNKRGPAYGTFALPQHPMNAGYAATDSGRSETSPNASILCFAASFLIETAMSLLLSTSRRSLRGEVDIAVLVGVGAALCFAAIGFGVFTRQRKPKDALLVPPGEEPDTVANGAKATIKGVCFVVICVWAGVLVAMSLI